MATVYEVLKSCIHLRHSRLQIVDSLLLLLYSSHDAHIMLCRRLLQRLVL